MAQAPFRRPSDPGTEVLRRNIRALVEVRDAANRRRTFGERVADRVTAFLGSIYAVGFHAVLYGGWILVNLGAVPGIEPFDPFPFVMLAMFASVEAIFLTTFVLISQNRMAEADERRADLDLQVSLLAEHELTKMIQLLDTIANRLGIESSEKPQLDEAKRDISPEAVLKTIEEEEERAADP